MINSGMFDYVNVLGKAASASYLRETVIANNIANDDTPGYQRQDVEFSSVLKDELIKIKYKNMDQAYHAVNKKLDHLEPIIYDDYAGYDYRIDGNNVDMDTENVELASEQLRYQAIVTSINNQFKRFAMIK